MGINGKVHISQCMIVKNEERNIEKALSWGKGIVGEQIVVDTGSSDRTVYLAKAMGASVYSFSWIDDFSAAKNFAISKAQGDWIVFLDADEVFTPEDAKKIPSILEQLEKTGTTAVVTGCMQLNDKGELFAAASHIRIFRNQPGLCYHRRIHEQLGWEDGTPLQVADATAQLSIIHSGYCGQAWKEKKTSRRNLDLILKELESNPSDHELMGYLGDEYFAAGQWDEAMDAYRKAIDAMPDVLDERDQRSAATFLHLMDLAQREPENGREICTIYRKAVKLLPEEADFDYILGFYYTSENMLAKGIFYLEQSLDKLNRYGCYNRAMLVTGHLQEVYETLAACCLFVGERDKAVRFSITVLKDIPYSMRALCILLQALSGQMEGERVPLPEITGLFEKIYNMGSAKDRLFILRAADEVSCQEIKEYMEGSFTDEELTYIRQAERRRRVED